MDNLDEWSVNLSRAASQLVPGEILKLQRSLVFLTLGAAVEIAPGRFRRISGVVLLTPVDTGRARSNWSISRGESPSAVIRPAGGTPLDATRAASELTSLGVYQTVWITNSLPYIRVLEYGGYPQEPVRGSWDRQAKRWIVKSVGGYSRQAPRGMVRITVEGLRSALGI
jgi:hypothetical protein